MWNSSYVIQMLLKEAAMLFGVKSRNTGGIDALTFSVSIILFILTSRLNSLKNLERYE